MNDIWYGMNGAEYWSEAFAAILRSIAAAAEARDWARFIQVVSDHGGLANIPRLDGASLDAPLHQAAQGGAPVEVVERLIALGAWRTLQNARGERPVDVADRQGRSHLLDILTPRYRHHVPPGVLLKIQAHFHDVIRGRTDRRRVADGDAGAEARAQAIHDPGPPGPYRGLRLPELEPLLELDLPEMWFPVPGMYGGFRYRLDRAGVEARLISTSSSRIVDGSGMRHSITSAGSELIEKGFV